MTEPGAPRGPIRILVAGRTDVGLVREHNEDAFVVVDLDRGDVLDVATMREITVGPRGMVLIVCDGMGGAAAGEIASAMAVETVREVMASGPDPPDPPDLEPAARKQLFAARLRRAAFTANTRIWESSRRDHSRIGMGTTMTAVGVIDDHLVMAQVGDSRAYLLRDGTLAQCTRDQSLVNELLESGQITPEQAVEFEHSNVILQALGVQEDVEVLLSTVDLRRGDRVVVCSDGLTGVVADEELGALMAVADDTAEITRLLVEVARNAGGPDNITAIVARFEGDGLALARADDPPLGYTRWHLDDSGPHPAPRPSETDEGPAWPRRRVGFARTFASAFVLFALGLASLMLAGTLYRGPSVRCTVTAPPGLAIRVDDHDVGTRTREDGVELRLPPGPHRIRLVGRGAPAGERHLEAVAGARCAAPFTPFAPATSGAVSGDAATLTGAGPAAAPDLTGHVR